MQIIYQNNLTEWFALDISYMQSYNVKNSENPNTSYISKIIVEEVNITSREDTLSGNYYKVLSDNEEIYIEDK